MNAPTNPCSCCECRGKKCLVYHEGHWCGKKKVEEKVTPQSLKDLPLTKTIGAIKVSFEPAEDAELTPEDHKKIQSRMQSIARFASGLQLDDDEDA